MIGLARYAQKVATPALQKTKKHCAPAPFGRNVKVSRLKPFVLCQTTKAEGGGSVCNEHCRSFVHTQ
jgi:hypothetical protein